MALTDDDVREILRIIDESALDELRLELPGLSLHVRKSGAPTAAALPAPEVRETGRSDVPEDADPSLRAATESTSGPGQAEANVTTIEAPMLGTFYVAEAPTDPPFVQVGDRVEPDTVVCLIEVMKLMNHIQAGMSGTVVEVLADNAKLVEFGQPLFRVEPDA